MMKKMFTFMLMLFCMPPGLFAAVNPFSSGVPFDLRVFIYPEILEYAINKYISPSKQDAAVQEYENGMDKDGQVNNAVLNKVCVAGGLDSSKCSAFKMFLMGGFKEGCDKDKGKPSVYCIDEAFYSLLGGTKVRFPEAVGLAIQYAKIKDNRDVFCMSEPRRVSGLLQNEVYVKCRTADGEHHYEFRFSDIGDSYMGGVEPAICKLYDVDFLRSNSANATEISELFSYEYEVMCNTTDVNKCRKINDSLAPFGRSASIGEMPYANGRDGLGKRKGCIITYVKTGLRTAFGLDSYKFKEVQYGIGSDLEGDVKKYVSNHLNKRGITLKSFDCDISTAKYGMGIFATDEVLTCYVNEQPVDFVFDDLAEWKSWSKDSGKGKLACAIIGGRIKGKRCHDVDKDQCADLNNKLIAQGKKGTYYDLDKGGCILLDSEIEGVVNLGIEIGVGVALAYFSGGVSLVVVAADMMTEVGFYELMEYLDNITVKDYHDFMDAAQKCSTIDKSIENQKCVAWVLSNKFGVINGKMNDLPQEYQQELLNHLVAMTGILQDPEIIEQVDPTYVPKTKEYSRQYAAFGALSLMFVFSQKKLVDKFDNVANYADDFFEVTTTWGDLAKVDDALDATKSVAKMDDLADLRKLSKADDALDVAQGLAKVDNIADLKKLDDVDNVTDLRFLNNSDEAGRIRIREIKDKYGIVFQDGKGKIVLPDDVDAILRKELGNSQVELRFYDDVRDFIRGYNDFDIGPLNQVANDKVKSGTIVEDLSRSGAVDKMETSSKTILKTNNFSDMKKADNTLEASQAVVKSNDMISDTKSLVNAKDVSKTLETASTATDVVQETRRLFLSDFEDDLLDARYLYKQDPAGGFDELIEKFRLEDVDRENHLKYLRKQLDEVDDIIEKYSKTSLFGTDDFERIKRNFEQDAEWAEEYIQWLRDYESLY